MKENKGSDYNRYTDLIKYSKIKKILMSIDPKILEILKKISDENQDHEISKILESWLKELDDGKLDLDQEENKLNFK